MCAITRSEDAMEYCPSFAKRLRRFGGFAAGGALVLLFLKPVLIVFLMVSACAAVGFVVWLPMHTVFFGRRATCHATWERSREWRHRAIAKLRAQRQRCEMVAQSVGDMLDRWARVVWAAFVEITSGTVTGILIGVALNVGEAAVGLGALLGGLIGTSIVLARRWQAGYEPEA
jgi:hypothetical protein